MLKTFLNSICAGILIAIGGSIFLSCDNKYVGAVLFSVALVCICYKGYVLFTGKVGYMIESHTKTDVTNLFIGLVGNLVTTILLGLLIRYAIPSIGENAEAICNAKLTTQAIPQTLVRSVFCGFLMYLAVSIFRDGKTPIGIILGIPVFILSGFEHSIADMFYFGASGIRDAKIAVFMITVIIGNSIGGMLLPLLHGDWNKKA